MTPLSDDDAYRLQMLESLAASEPWAMLHESLSALSRNAVRDAVDDNPPCSRDYAAGRANGMVRAMGELDRQIKLLRAKANRG